MQYKNLVNAEVIEKLMSATFSNPTLNQQVFNFCKGALVAVEYFENEKMKLFDVYGTEKDGLITIDEENKEVFTEKIKELLEQHVKPSLPKLILTIDDFKTEKCVYRKSSEYWLNGFEQNEIVEMVKSI